MEDQTKQCQNPDAKAGAPTSEHSSERRCCQNCKNDFVIEAEDVEYYEKIEVPPPTFCPSCRLQRRLAFQNQRNLYKRKCDLCDKAIVSVHREDVAFPVYCMNCWESDDWDPTSYAKDYDFSRSFFEQFAELKDLVPKKALMGIYPSWHNSEYNNMAHELKNCYLLFNSDFNEDCMYGSEVERSRNCVDTTMIDSCENTYSSVGCSNCHGTYFSSNCEDSHDIWFSRDLVNCSDCFGCVALRGKKHYIFNKPYSKEEYLAKLEEMDTSSYQGKLDTIEKVNELYKKTPKRFMHGRRNKDVSGEYINNSKETYDSYVATGAENCRYCMWLVVKPSRDCYDYTQLGDGAQNIYESLTSGVGISDIKFSIFCVGNVARVSYGESCYKGATDLFGCLGIRKKQYCILNKQYSKEEYEELVEKIRVHMDEMPYEDKNGRVYKYGEFFPIEISPFMYNETDAQEYFTMSKEEVLEKGYQWFNFEEKDHQETISWKDLPDKGAEDSIVDEVILCQEWDMDAEKAMGQVCTKVFKVLPKELEFYKKNNLPLPRKCPNCRHIDRVKTRNPIKLWNAKCSCAGAQSDGGTHDNTGTHFHESEHCPNEFKTPYNPEKADIVYCEQCYQQEMV